MLVEARLLIIADDPLARAGLVALLEEQADALIVGRASSQDAALALDVYQPDLLVWDLGWDAAVALERLAELEGAIPVAALIADEATAASAWTAGAQALLWRESSAARILAAVTAVDQGLTVFEPELLDLITEAQNQRPDDLPEPLTSRELEVARLLAEGLTNKAIAQKLSISDHTVKFHVNAIMSKLSAQSRTDAVVRATRLGLISL